MNNPTLPQNIQELLVRFFENDLNDHQRNELLEWSRKDPHAGRIYCHFMKDYALISTLVTGQVQREYGSSEDSHFDQALWQALADYEKSAPQVNISKDEPQEELIHKVVYPPREKRRISTFSIIGLSAAAAAVLFMIAFFHFVPKKTMVAEVIESMNTEWANGVSAVAAGDYLYNTDEPRFLKSGLVKIRFDYGATAILEGPCKFSCKSANLLGLQYGRAFASVPVQASGFTIDTPISRITDLGTEFGVEVIPNGYCSAQVHKGKARIVSSLQKGHAVSELIEARQARKVDNHTGEIRDFTFDEKAYVQSFDPVSKTVFRGEKFNLADVIGGGNGFGTGRYDVCGINPQNGSTDQVRLIHSARTAEQSTYSTVSGLAYVDGVFIPSSVLGEVPVSSGGHTFIECPPTSGECNSNILNQPALYPIPGELPTDWLGGRQYGTNERPALFMHANAGITFDLDAIRQSNPHVSIVRFSSTCGIADITVPGHKLEKPARADFWVLVDGEKRAEFHAVLTTANDQNVGQVDVAIGPDDRFLTLIVTEANDKNIRDWTLFGSPYLTLE